MKHIFEYNEYDDEDMYYKSMNAGIVPFCTVTKRLLVGLRSGQVSMPYTWGGFGGAIDTHDYHDENAIERGALRELREETLYGGEIKLILGYIYKERSFEYHNYFGLVYEEFAPILNWENDKYKWLTLEQLLKLPKKHPGLKKFLIESKHLLNKYI